MATAVKGSGITTLEQFEERYCVKVDEDFVKIAEKTSGLVKAELSKRPENKHHCLKTVFPDAHFNKGIYYFVLESNKYTAKYIYSYHLDSNRIKHVYGPAKNPEFFEDRMVEFGTGFTVPGPQGPSLEFRTGEAVIRVYQLTHPNFTQVNHIMVKDGGGCGWDGHIDEETKEIVAFDHVKGTTKRFSIFDKA